MSVGKVLRAEDVKVSIALHGGAPFAVPPVKETLLAVARLVTDSVLEHIPAVPALRSGIAEFPGVDSDSAVSAVVVAEVVVAFLVANVVSSLAVTAVLDTLLPLDVGVVTVVDVGVVHSSKRSLVVDVTVLSPPGRSARTVIVTNLVNAPSMLAGIVSALVPCVLLTLPSCGTWGTDALVASAIVKASSTILTRGAVTALSGKLAVGSVESGLAEALMSLGVVRANSSIQTRVVLAEIALGFTVASLPAGLAVALVVVV